MHLLAYHPDHLRALRQALADASTELAGTTCWVYEALDANAAVRRMRNDIDTFLLPIVDRLLAAAPLHRSSPGVDLDRLDQSLMRVMSGGYGWSLARDHVADDPTVVTAAEARALGAMLNDVDIDALLADPDQLDWLAQQLEIISRDPALTEAFLANFHEWAVLCDALGYARIDLTVQGDRTANDDLADVARIDRVAAALAATYTTQLTQQRACIDPAALIPEFDEMTPYAAALLARAMPLEPEQLATLSVLILQRWEAASTYEYDAFMPGPNAADLLFEALTHDPQAAAAFVLQAAGQPSIIFQSADNPALAYNVVLLGTAPGNLPTELAGEVIVSLVQWFELSASYLNPVDPTYPTGWELFLVDLISPWTLQFSPLNDDWRDTFDDADTSPSQLLAFVVQHDGAIDRLIANGDVLLGGVMTSLDDDNERAVAELVAYLNMLSQLILNRRVADATAEAAAWDLLIDVVGVVAAVATIPASPAVGFGVDVLLYGGGKALGAWIPNPADVDEWEQMQHEHRQAAVAGALALACYRALVSQGRLPSTIDPPPTVEEIAVDDNPVLAYRRAIDAWLAELGRAGFADEADLIGDVVREAVNAAMAGEDAGT